MLVFLYVVFLRTMENKSLVKNILENILVKIDFLANKETSMEEFKQSFDVVYEAGKQIVNTGNASPRELMKNGLSEKLVSRLEWGRVLEISSELQIIPEQVHFSGNTN